MRLSRRSTILVSPADVPGPHAAVFTGPNDAVAGAFEGFEEGLSLDPANDYAAPAEEPSR
jgi:hypothetical protein